VRALLPTPADVVDVHASYAAGWLEPGGVRVNFIAAADGAVSVDGVSRGLQTPGDNTVFAALRDLADVVLAGSGTAVAEGYGAVHPSGARLAARRAYGLADVLPVAVSSRSLHLDPAAALFTGADPAGRTIVLTCTAADAGRRAALAEVADVVDCGTDVVEPARARAALAERGLTRVLCEGGPTLFAQWAAAGAADELCLSLSPRLGGPGAGRITAGDHWDSPVPLTLTGLLEEDGALFLRYRLG
jgi:riboflavin biosynthesis pyrimidine reductase